MARQIEYVQNDVGQCVHDSVWTALKEAFVIYNSHKPKESVRILTSVVLISPVKQHGNVSDYRSVSFNHYLLTMEVENHTCVCKLLEYDTTRQPACGRCKGRGATGSVGQGTHLRSQ